MAPVIAPARSDATKGEFRHLRQFRRTLKESALAHPIVEHRLHCHACAVGEALKYRLRVRCRQCFRNCVRAKTHDTDST